jgi:hypothetical protein
MNSRIRQGCAIAASILVGSMGAIRSASAETDASLTQVFEAVCLKPADAEGRKAAAYAQGLRTPPESFRSKRLVGKGATPELHVWKAVEGSMMMVSISTEPFPGTKDVPALTCQAMLTPGEQDSLANWSAALGLPSFPEGAAAVTVAFEDFPDGRKVVDLKDEAAADAAMEAGRLRIVTVAQSNSKNDVAMIMLLRPLWP